MAEINTEIPVSPDDIIGERKKRIFSVKTFILFLFSLMLVIYLLRNLQVEEALLTFRNADPLLLLLACGIYFLSNLFRSLRFAVMLDGGNTRQLDLYAITSYHTFFNQVLPARTGELTFVYYLNRISHVDISRGLYILLVTRIFDFIVVTAFFLCSLVFHYGSTTPVALFSLGIFFFLGSIVVFFNLKWLVVFLNNIFILLATILKLDHLRLIMNIKKKMKQVVEEFSSLDTKRFMPQLALTSILIWGTIYTFSYLIIHAFRVDLGFLQSVVGTTSCVLTNMLPINSFGSFGTMEAGWTGGFILVGMSAQDAIITGFGNHIVSFVASAISAIACFVMVRRR